MGNLRVNKFKYSNYRQMMTGFENSIDHGFYRHWSNPEYQEQECLCNMTEEEYELYIKQKEDKSNNEEYLPF